MQSTAIQLLTAAAGDTLTATLTATTAESSRGVRCQSGTQLQFYVKYTPDAGNTTSATYAEWETQYTIDPADTEDVSGGSGTFTWRSFTVELTTVSDDATTVGGATHVSEFQIARWRARANDTANKDRWPTFSLPLACSRVRLLVREVGAGSSFGTFLAHVATQPI